MIYNHVFRKKNSNQKREEIGNAKKNRDVSDGVAEISCGRWKSNAWKDRSRVPEKIKKSGSWKNRCLLPLTLDFLNKRVM